MTNPPIGKPMDPLRRVFVPREDPMGRFRTHDGEAYRRDSAGTIRRASPKVRGKAARKAAKSARRREAQRVANLREGK